MFDREEDNEGSAGMSVEEIERALDEESRKQKEEEMARLRLMQQQEAAEREAREYAEASERRDEREMGRERTNGR